MMLALGAIPIAALSGCNRWYEAEFTAFSAETGEGIEEADVELDFARRGYFSPRNRVLETDESGQAITTLSRWPFLIVRVNEPGYDPYRVSNHRARYRGAEGANAENILSIPDPVTTPRTAPRSFSRRDIEGQRRSEFELGLEWDERPTVLVRVPDGFRGLMVLERVPSEDPLPEAPELRVFESELSASGVATVPSWPRTVAPYVHYRFFTESGQEIPRTRLDFTGPAAKVLRRQRDSLVAFIGNEREEAAVRRVLWVEDPLEVRFLVREPAFEAAKSIVREAQEPVTAAMLEAELGEAGRFGDGTGS